MKGHPLNHEHSGSNNEGYMVRVMVRVMMNLHGGSGRCRDIHIYYYLQHSSLDVPYENVLVKILRAKIPW